MSDNAKPEPSYTEREDGRWSRRHVYDHDGYWATEVTTGRHGSSVRPSTNTSYGCEACGAYFLKEAQVVRHVATACETLPWLSVASARRVLKNASVLLAETTSSARVRGYGTNHRGVTVTQDGRGVRVSYQNGDNDYRRYSAEELDAMREATMVRAREVAEARKDWTVEDAEDGFRVSK